MKLSKNKVLSYVLNIILDLFFAFILLFSAIATIITFSTNKSVFGKRLGIVLSESMTASGINVGDVIYINAEQNYNVGDIIAFYRTVENYDKDAAAVPNLDTMPIWFHEIVDVKVDDKGRTSYLTKGTSNEIDDFYYVPIDYVIGVGKPLGPRLNTIMRFVLSRKGIIWLIVVPCTAMLIYLTWVLVMIITEEKPKNVIETKTKDE